MGIAIDFKLSYILLQGYPLTILKE